MEFPAPKRFSILGYDSFGYADRVIYPLIINLDPQKIKSKRNLVLASELNGLVCSDVCIPIREMLTLSMSNSAQKTAEPSVAARDIALFKSRVPRPGTAAGIALIKAEIQDDHLVLQFDQNADKAITAPKDILIEAPSGYAFSAPKWQGTTARLAVKGRALNQLSGAIVTVTAIGQDWLLEAPIKISAVSTIGPVSGVEAGAGIFGILMIAFLGGLILNIMPCVLPVISLSLVL